MKLLLVLEVFNPVVDEDFDLIAMCLAVCRSVEEFTIPVAKDPPPYFGPATPNRSLPMYQILCFG